jgi:predicted dehydrogenase
LKRRDFIEASTAAFTALSASKVLGANDTVRVALVGCGGRGRSVAAQMQKAPNTEFTAVCDVYEQNAALASKQLTGSKAKVMTDFRRLLDGKDVDAVLIATPDHWHAPIAVLACEAGKDAFIEKPFALTVREGRAVADAAKKHKRIVQAGTQHRSSPHIAEAARMVQNGEIGEVHLVRVWNSGNIAPNGLPEVPDSDPPAGLDWDFYLGPAPKVPFNKRRFLGTYRQYFDYSGGYLTDYGNHRIDSVHQIMGVSAPLTVSASGGRYCKANAGDIPDVLQVTYEYPSFILDYTGCWLNNQGIGGRSPGMSYYGMRGDYNRPHGFAFFGSKGSLFVDRVGWELFPEVEPMPLDRIFAMEQPPKEVKYRAERKSFNGSDATAAHAQNFIGYVRSRETPFADAEVGHRSTSACLIGNIAYKTGKKLKWNSETEDFVGEPEASRMLKRIARKPWDLIPAQAG